MTPKVIILSLQHSKKITKAKRLSFMIQAWPALTRYAILMMIKAEWQKKKTATAHLYHMNMMHGVLYCPQILILQTSTLSVIVVIIMIMKQAITIFNQDITTQIFVGLLIRICMIWQVLPVKFLNYQILCLVVIIIRLTQVISMVILLGYQWVKDGATEFVQKIQICVYKDISMWKKWR